METRMHMLRPAEFAARREECPIAYIPLGIIEWHGDHNPLGSDSIQAEELAIRCSKKGGLALPPLYYGDIRPYTIMEGSEPDIEHISKTLKTDPKWHKPDFIPYSFDEQRHFHITLLKKMLYQCEAYGFKAAVLICGHYPLIETAIDAVEEFNKEVKKSRPDGLVALACLDFEMVNREEFPKAGDHAAGWETSHMLAICPDRVDMNLAPEFGTPGVGVGGLMPATEATAEYGNRAFDAACEGVVKKAKFMLSNREEYLADF